MTASLLLIAYAFAVAVLAPRALRDRAWTLRAPRLAILSWYTAVASVGAGLALAAGIVLAVPDRTWEALCELLRLCAHALSRVHEWLGAFALVAAVALAAVAAVRLTDAAVRTLLPSMRRRQRQARAFGRTGRRLRRLGATLVDHDTAAAFLVPGRSATIVVTSAAVETLNDAELAAVVAHERGHHAGRHHLLIDAMRVLTRAFPRSRLLATAHAQVALLVEVCADDAAVERHSRIDLARALVAMAEAQHADGSVYAGALAISGGDAAIRLRRLLDPPEPVRHGWKAVLGAALVALAAVPVALTAAAWAWPVLLDCPLPW